MNTTHYLEDSSRTEAGQPMRVDLVSDYDFVHTAAKAFVAIQELDAMKKALFYGKKSDTLLEPEDESDYFNNPASKDIIHGILGIVTEAGELLELLLNPDKLTRAKLIDECGDHQWYHALIYREIGTDYDEVLGKNILKLKARFPTKFTELNAIVRNESRENAVFQ